MGSKRPKLTKKNAVNVNCLIQMGDGTSPQCSSAGRTDDLDHHRQDTLKDKGQRLYKTEICRNYEELNTCRYGLKCRYAHGKEELRSVQRHPRYKTIFCRTYEAVGECPYGIRCTFLHKSPSTTSLPPSPPPEQTSCPPKKSILIHPPPAQPATSSLKSLLVLTNLPSSSPILTPPGLDPMASSFRFSAPTLCSSFTRPSHYDDGQQQRLKAAFYSQENQTPMPAKHQISRSGFTENDEFRRGVNERSMAYYVYQ